MFKVASINESHDYAAMVSALCETEGHRTFTSIWPVDAEKLAVFEPDLLILGLFRQPHAFDRPLHHPEQDVAGLDVARALDRCESVRTTPVLILGHGIGEAALPGWLHYDLFLQFPTDMRVFLAKVQELAALGARRALSGYRCPHCGSQLADAASAEAALQCARCHTAVWPGDGTTPCRYRVGGTELEGTCTLEPLALSGRAVGREAPPA